VAPLINIALIASTKEANIIIGEIAFKVILMTCTVKKTAINKVETKLIIASRFEMTAIRIDLVLIFLTIDCEFRARTMEAHHFTSGGDKVVFVYRKGSGPLTYYRTPAYQLTT
jgi:hypothetical protein